MTTPVTRLFFVRHGATTASAEDRFAGAIDTPLSEEGRRQARLLGERLASEQTDAFYASPMSRAMETARLACREPQPIPALKEIAHGHWEGLTRAEACEKYPTEFAAWEEDPFTFAPEGGESGVAV